MITFNVSTFFFAWRKKMRVMVASIILLHISFFLPAQVKLPELVSNGMVLQRNIALPIWGWAAPGEKIAVTFKDKQYTTTTAPDRKWKLYVDAQPAGGPFTMQIKGAKSVTEIRDILIGEVWLCSGQSNMAYKMKASDSLYAKEIAGSENPQIRMFEVSYMPSPDPQLTTSGATWQLTNPTSVVSFSAVGYFFGKELYERYKVPIGLINASVGGTVAQAWTSIEGLKQFPDYLNRVKLLNQVDFVQQETANAYVTAAMKWMRLLVPADSGFINGRPAWSRPDYDASAWKTINMPSWWEKMDALKEVDGIVWFRKEIMLPDATTAKNRELLLSGIDDIDLTYLNGVLIGAGYEKKVKRSYTIPAGLIKKGKNVLTIRVINRTAHTGIYGKLPVEIVIDKHRSSLDDQWQYRLSSSLAALPAFPAANYAVRNEPTFLYNGMINPIIPYAIKGAIWYQGESNTDKAFEYQRLFPAMISDWRSHWAQGDFPFLYVQLANYRKPVDTAGKSTWAELREAQLNALSVPHTGMAVILDIGEEKNIHPKNKKEVGKRLALAAQKVAYGEQLVHAGPMYKTIQVKNNKIEIAFELYESALKTNDNKPLRQFAIAGTDKKFKPAQAEISGNKVIVWSDEVAAPVAVRYAWADNPAGCNLYNKEGLPASSFRTDGWQE